MCFDLHIFHKFTAAKTNHKISSWRIKFWRVRPLLFYCCKNRVTFGRQVPSTVYCPFFSNTSALTIFFLLASVSIQRDKIEMRAEPQMIVMESARLLISDSIHNSAASPIHQYPISQKLFKAILTFLQV